ncbi:MAG: HNH endonuclease [Leptospirales bacterium]|nr:HNH endonuclease [Leptospirales bacterium]
MESIIRSFVIFFPIYDSVIRLSLGIDDRFDQLLGILNRFLTDYYESEETPDAAPETAEPEIIDTNAAAVAVDAVKVRVGLRWQVFDRDNFRCVVCGRTAHDGIILHVDHITPRSLGGPDELDNFQTLCHLCNLGKSNKSDRNLRKKED